MSRKLSFSILIAASGSILLGLLAAPLLQADEPSLEDYVKQVKQSRRQSALASDRTADPTKEVAREILQLQQNLGGSVVSDRPQLQDFRDTSPLTPTPPHPPARQRGWTAHTESGHGYRTAPQATRPPTKVAELREAAWQLETTAHRLEHLDLYDQADALRDVAARLRRDARAMKQAENANVDASVE